MRIAVNTRFLLKGKLEGIGWYTYEVLKNMVASHPEDEFIFLFDRKYDEKFIFAKNVKGIVVHPMARHPLLWYIWFEISIPSVLKREKADVFFSPDGYCSLKSRVPTLMTIHDLAYVHYPNQVSRLTKMYYEYFVPKFVKRAEKIATVSDFVKEDIVKQFNISSEKIFRAHNAARAEFQPIAESKIFQVRQEYSNGEPYFLYYGAIHPRKNVVRIIQAFEKFKEEHAGNLRLLLVGRLAWQTDEVSQILRQSKYATDITHIDYLSDDLPKIVASAYAVVYTSLFEGFGLPVLEAMQSGVPVITSNVSSMPEVAGDAGICVNPLEISQIANAMKKLVEDKILYRSLQEKGIERSKQFNWADTAKRIYGELKGIV